MDVLDRLLGHDEWTTALPLEVSRVLRNEQLDQPSGVGHGTLREAFDHMIGNVETWTDLMAGRAPARAARPDTLDSLVERHARSYAAFAALARRLRDEGRLDDTDVDVLDEPPTRKTFGGTLVHVITHTMFHRADLLHILARLGVPGLPEGDALSWEADLRAG